jgi:ATP-dependent RNA helicase DDX60
MPDLHESLPGGLWKAVSSAYGRLESEDTRVRGIVSVPLTTNIPSQTNEAILGAVIKAYCSMAPLLDSPELLYIFIAHCVLMENVSIEERSRPLPMLNDKLSQDIIGSFLPRIFLAVDTVLGGHEAGSIDIDGRMFMTLVHFFIANASLPIRRLVGDSVYERVKCIWSGAIANPPTVDFLKFSNRFPHPPLVPLPASAPKAKQQYALLPFSNKVFDEELSSIRVNILPPTMTDHELVVPPLPPSTPAAHLEFGSQGGILFSDTQHWHNTRRPILPSHHGGKEDPKPALTEWQKRRKLRSEQRFMATLQQQAGTLTGALGAVLKQIVIPAVGSGSGSKVGKLDKGKGVVKVGDFMKLYSAPDANENADRKSTSPS